MEFNPKKLIVSIVISLPFLATFSNSVIGNIVSYVWGLLIIAIWIYCLVDSEKLCEVLI